MTLKCLSLIPAPDEELSQITPVRLWLIKYWKHCPKSTVRHFEIWKVKCDVWRPAARKQLGAHSYATQQFVHPSGTSEQHLKPRLRWGCGHRSWCDRNNGICTRLALPRALRELRRSDVTKSRKKRPQTCSPFKGKRKVTTQLRIYPELSFDKVIRAQLARALMAEHHTVSACS